MVQQSALINKCFAKVRACELIVNTCHQPRHLDAIVDIEH